MKRIAMFAVLAVSALAADLRAQTVHGYSKFPIKDPTLVSRRARGSRRGRERRRRATRLRTACAHGSSSRRHSDTPPRAPAQGMHPHLAAMYAQQAGHSPYSRAAHNQMGGAATMPPQGGMPNTLQGGQYPRSRWSCIPVMRRRPKT